MRQRLLVNGLRTYTEAVIRRKNAFRRIINGKSMDASASLTAEVAALRAATDTATQVRGLAQDRIVQAFGDHLRGAGTGPTDEELQSFARFALVEAALQKHLDAVLGAAGASHTSYA
jgi:hypothetical protein